MTGLVFPDATVEVSGGLGVVSLPSAAVQMSAVTRQMCVHRGEGVCVGVCHSGCVLRVQPSLFGRIYYTPYITHQQVCVGVYMYFVCASVWGQIVSLHS